MISSYRFVCVSLFATALAAGPALAQIPPSQKCQSAKLAAAARYSLCAGKAEALVVKELGSCNISFEQDCYHGSECPSGEQCIKAGTRSDKILDQCEEKLYGAMRKAQDTAAAEGDACRTSGDFSAVESLIEQMVRDIANLTDGFSNSHRVFVTSDVTDGNLGLLAGGAGLAGGDLFCQSAANAAGIGGTWMAWLSNNVTSAGDRLPLGRFRLMNGFEIASSKAQFLNGTLAAPINISERGHFVNLPSTVWTGTNSDGSGDEVLHCSDWTSTATQGAVGRSDTNRSEWTTGETHDCSEYHRLYCIEM